MGFIILIILFLIGLVLIVKGGDFFVDSAVWIAEMLNVPNFLIGATIVSVATTLPEIFVSTIAANHGKIEMAAANALGSVIANTGLVFAVAIIFLPTKIRRSHITPKGSMFLVSLIVLGIFASSGVISYYASFGLFILFLLFIVENIKIARKELLISKNRINIKPKKPDRKVVLINMFKFIFGAISIVIGSNLIVTNGSEIARLFNINERIISITAVAIATSLPELVTTISAIVKKQSSLSVGNIIGANIIDITLILPICAFVTGGAITLTQRNTMFDIFVCFVIASFLIVPTIIKGEFKRWQGFYAIVFYMIYIIFILTGFY